MLSLALSALSLNNAPLRAGRAPTKASVSMKVEDLVGGINDPIFGGTPEGKIFDPLGLGKDEASLYRRRVVEIKHGRICMVAFLGMTVGPNDVRRRCSPASSRRCAALRPAGALAAPRRLRRQRRPPQGWCRPGRLIPAQAAQKTQNPTGRRRHPVRCRWHATAHLRGAGHPPHWRPVRVRRWLRRGAALSCRSRVLRFRRRGHFVTWRFRRLQCSELRGVDVG